MNEYQVYECNDGALFVAPAGANLTSADGEYRRVPVTVFAASEEAALDEAYALLGGDV